MIFTVYCTFFVSHLGLIFTGGIRLRLSFFHSNFFVDYQIQVIQTPYEQGDPNAIQVIFFSQIQEDI